jgi:hypothetical protein
MTEDEAKAVAAVAAQCLTWSGWRRWEPVMRYGRLFTPGTDAVAGRRGMPRDPGRKAWRLAVDSGLLYAEGYAAYPSAGAGGFPRPWAWCLDGETVVDPAAPRPGTAFFGVALRPQYMRRVHAAQRGDDDSEGFLWAFTRGDQENPPLDPAADIASDLGRDIPSAVREWALTAERHPWPARRPPDWVLAELLGGDGPDPAGQDRIRGLFVPSLSQPAQDPPPPPSPGPYARYLVRFADWFNSGMALQCGGQADGADREDAHIVGMIHDGDSVATLMRMADEHRPRCEHETAVAGEAAEKPAYTPAEARLQSAGRTFAVLRRLEYHTWDAWLRPAGRRVTRNGVSYEMAFAAVFRAMGAAMPADFTTVYAGEQPDPASFAPADGLSAPPGSRLPMSYERHLIRPGGFDGHDMTLQESGRTAGINGSEGSNLEGGVANGTSLAALIQVAGERWPIDVWTVCPADERVDPELTVQKNAEVILRWGPGYFAALQRVADGTWDALVVPSRVRAPGGEKPTELLTPLGVSYEMALAAVFRAMGDNMPTGFEVGYLDRRITPR